jgi:hypothetical protein
MSGVMLNFKYDVLTNSTVRLTDTDMIPPSNLSGASYVNTRYSAYVVYSESSQASQSKRRKILQGEVK